MANSDKLIETLNDFTHSLDALVDVLKEQSKNDPTELLNKIVSSFDGDVLDGIVKDISIIKENVVNINKNTDKILKVVKDEKKSKETGMFGQMENKSSKEKIIGAISTVVLIAAGVLAIGMAFKIVGDVDFVSVVALGMGIMFVAYAFAKVASIKDDDGKPMTYKSAFQTSAIMVIMSGAILVSGFILNMMPIISPMALLSVAGVGIAIGLSSFFVLKAISKLKDDEIKKAFKLPILLPLVSLGLVASGFILNMMPVIGFTQLLSALGVGLVFVPIFLSIGFIAKYMKNVTMDEIIDIAFMLPILSLGIVISSWILLLTADISIISVLKAGFGVGLASLALLPTLIIMKKFGLLEASSLDDLLIGVGAIALISTAIMVSSWILSMGNYDGAFPSWEWSLGVGLAILTFSAPMLGIGMLIASSGGLGLAGLILGMIAIPIIAISIVIASYILQAGSYDNPVPLEWAIGTGLLFLTYGAAMVVLGVFLPLIGLGFLSMSLIALSIAASSGILSTGNYDIFPDYKWSLSVGLLMIAYGATMAVLGLALPLLFLGSFSMSVVAESIVETSKILSSGNYDVYPSVEWSKGVGGSIIAFATALMIQSNLGLFSLFGGKTNLSAFIINVSDAIKIAGESFSGTDGLFSSYPSEKWAKGVGGSIMAFAKALSIQQDLKTGFFGDSSVDMSAFIISVSDAIKIAGESFSGTDGLFKDGTYPSEKWAKGVGGSILAFAKALAIVQDLKTGFFGDRSVDLSAFIINISDAIKIAGEQFSKTSGLFKDGTYPSEKWAKGVGGSILAFAKAMQALDDAGIDLDDPDDGEIIYTIWKWNLEYRKCTK